MSRHQALRRRLQCAAPLKETDARRKKLSTVVVPGLAAVSCSAAFAHGGAEASAAA